MDNKPTAPPKLYREHSEGPSRRPRGGQPGNANALRHGFYSRRFQKRELTDLETASFQGLAEEIALIRLFARRLVEKYTPACDLYDTAHMLRMLCFASTCIDRMLKTQTFITSIAAKNEWQQSILEATQIVNEEWDLENLEQNASPTAFRPPPFTPPPE